MKKVIAVTLSLVFLWFVSSPQSVYADTNNKLKTKPINIAFCFNENLWMQAGIAITSLLCTAEEKCCYNIYCVVPDSVNQTMRNILVSFVKKRSPMSSIKFLTVTNHLDSIEDGTKRAACYRLLLPKLLPDLDKVIYTDVDVIFNDDLQEMDKIDMSKYYVAGVTWRYKRGFWILLENEVQDKLWDEYGLYDISDKGQYINSGVLIFNLKKIRQDGIDKKWFELTNENFIHPDQQVINITCAGNVLVLPGNYCSDGDKILHFDGQLNKPWEIHHEGTPAPKYWELWWYYAGQTQFAPCFMKSMMRKQYDVMKDMMQKQLDDRFKVLPKWLSRVFCWFIPKKEARHKFRKKYMTE
jgi:lipopolysaccharide biosynthesis glycosyltransferase